MNELTTSDGKATYEMLLNFDYKLWNGKVVGVDFDGTLAHYNGWKGHEHIGPLKRREKPAYQLGRLEENHYMIMIHTCRSVVPPVAKFLEGHEIPYHTININPFQPEGVSPYKLFADHYIDDRQAGYPGLPQCVDAILESDGYGEQGD